MTEQANEALIQSNPNASRLRATVPTDDCLIVCITSDDDGRGYWCDWCPEKAKHAKGRPSDG
jgi:hypothetical protein